LAQLHDLLALLREEFELAATEVDDHLSAWIGDAPEQAPLHCEALVDTLNRLASVMRMVQLEGLALVIEDVRDAAQLLALSDETDMAQGVGWLALWRHAVVNALSNPGTLEPAQALLEYLAEGPLPPDEDRAAQLLHLLQIPPHFGEEDAAKLAAQFAPPTAADVSLAIPDEVDAGLLETFLSDAPGQLARLGDAVRQLARHGLDGPALEDAQRVAHTFKGSGNIIGIRGVGQLAHRIEDLLEFAQQQGGQLPTPMAHSLEQATATLDQMIYALRGEEEEPEQALAQLTELVDWARAIQDDTWMRQLEGRPSNFLDLESPVSDAPDFAPSAPAGVAEPRPEVPLSGPVKAQVQPVVARFVAPPMAPPMAPAPMPPVAPTPDARATPPHETRAENPQEAQVRVGSGRLDALVRRAGQSLIQLSRQGERMAQLEQRLVAANANHALLGARLRQLMNELARQGAGLAEKKAQAGDSFDPLELNRYHELQSLGHFVNELAADSQELTAQAHAQTRDLLSTHTEQERGLKLQHRELLNARLVPLRTIAGRLRRNVSQTAAATGKQAQLRLEGEDVMLDSSVLERLTEALLHLLRNAVDHGVETPDERLMLGKPSEGQIVLRLRSDGPYVHIECEDDGCGLDLEAIRDKARQLGLLDPLAAADPERIARLILLPGFSTRDKVTEVSGRGVGMDVVAQRLRALKGELDIHTQPLRGTRFTIRLPASLGMARVLVVEVAGERFALPAEGVRMGVAASVGRRTPGQLEVDGQTWPCTPLAPLIGLHEAHEVTDADASRPRPAVVLRSGRQERAVLVDQVVESRELILQEPGNLLRQLPTVGGSALRPDGRVLFVLDPAALVQSELPTTASLQALRARSQTQRKRLLVVDDSLSVRKLLSQLLTDAGYAVRTARDGFEALQELQTASADLVITDLEMPNLNGLELARALRHDGRWRTLPVIMLTSRASEKHRTSAAQAGVNRYITKPYTDEDLLAEVLELLASPSD
jgi:chemotaxis protein histidine kinase CheA/ActR/RegA family two-component response regulator